MSVTSILNQLFGDGQRSGDLCRSLEIFVPELILCGTVVAMLLVRICGQERRVQAWSVALVGALIAFLAIFSQFFGLLRDPDGMLRRDLPVAVHSHTHPGETESHSHAEPVPAAKAKWTSKSRFAGLYRVFGVTNEGVGQPGAYFTGMMKHDTFGVAFRLGLCLFLVIMVALSVVTGLPDAEDGQDFYTLLFGATIGMLVASGANHLIMLFMAIEMMSVPSYAMVGFLKGRKQSSEAALKYVVYGAGAAGVMLYGISLVAGLLGTGDMAQLGERFATLMGGDSFSLASGTSLVLVLGTMLVLVGFAFKLSLFPFHFWCPDAFEGATAEVGGFLSVASKAGAFALLVRFVTAFIGPHPAQQQFVEFIGLSIGVIACASMTLGNLSAYRQENLKRLLAYSTIAHAGYMVLAVSAILVLSSGLSQTGLDATTTADMIAKSLEGLMVYLTVYLFMNITAFAIIALLRNQTFREELAAYRGLFASDNTTKWLCVALVFSFMSLVGLPPFGGWVGKFMIFTGAFAAGSVHWLMWLFVAIGGINTVFSLFYYVRVLKTMLIEAPEPGAKRLSMPGTLAAFVMVLAVPILLIGVVPGPLIEMAGVVSRQFITW